MSLKIRAGTREDIPALITMGETFYAESNFAPGGYDAEQFFKTLEIIFSGNSHHVLVAEHEEKPIGFVIFDIARHYTSYSMACMFLLYVHRASRKYGAGPKLINAAAHYSKVRGAKYFYGSSSAGFDDGGRNERVLKAIYKRQGFKDNGIFMRKEL